MNLIRNFSILILFFGIILMTIYITKSYAYSIEDKLQEYKELQKKKIAEYNIRRENSTKPSKMFDKMFKEPTVWMGNSDPYTITRNNKKENFSNTYSKAFD
jgi:hypothetical protein